jgi:phosphoribosylanthranilate isomerase
MSPANIWIKICGNTSLEDAQLAADSGADAVGFVFAASPRRVTSAAVAAIVSHLPAALEKIGVFVDASFEEIEATVNTSGLTGVQLHFDAAPDLPARLRAHFGSALRILRVIHCDAVPAAPESARTVGRDFRPGIKNTELGGALASEGHFSDRNVDATLVDSRTTTTVGGTGRTFDWALASKALLQNASACKLIAAGGLNPENIAEAIATLHPWGVDAVSGVEAAPGRKDPAKVRAFIANARTAD